MKLVYYIIIVIVLASCKHNSQNNSNREGRFSGTFISGNFSDSIQFEIERDSTNWKVFFTSLEQNANRIPSQDVIVNGDSISFKLQSDYYTYNFKNKWSDNFSKLNGTLFVDFVAVNYILEKEFKNKHQKITVYQPQLSLH